MHEANCSPQPLDESAISEDSPGEFPAIPRWGQILAGLLLLPVTLLCTGGAVTLFGVPKVQADPALQFLAAVISLLCLWTVLLAGRLLLGIKGRGLLGPVALRIVAAAAVGLVIVGLFTRAWVDHPYRSAGLSITYVLAAIRLCKLADHRSRKIA